MITSMKKKITACVFAVLMAGTAVSCGHAVPSSSGSSRADDSGIRSDLSASVEEKTEADLIERPEEADDSVSGGSYPGGTDSFPRDISLSDTPLSREAAVSRDEYVIYCPDETLPDLFALCYPGYESVTDTVPDENGIRTAEGRIGEVKIHWIISDYLSDDEAAGHLDELLLRQQAEGASEYDWVDLFVVDDMNLEKYIGDKLNVTLELKELGIKESQMKQQLPYTRKLAGGRRKQCGAALDISPGLFLYRRSVAKEVLGTDDTEEVGRALADWDAFRATAVKAGEAGYKMLAGYDAAFDVYSQAGEREWFPEDGNINVDDSLLSWVNDTEKYAREGICGDSDIGTEQWLDGIKGKGDIFGYFLSGEEIVQLRDIITEDNENSYGDFGLVPGPGEWYRGGIWICAAVGTPSPDLSADIIRNLTCDETVMRDIWEKTGMIVNNKKLLSEESFRDPMFSMQQTGSVYLQAAERIQNPVDDLERWILDGMFREAYYPYFRGECSANEALASFYQNAKSLIITEDEEW